MWTEFIDQLQALWAYSPLRSAAICIGSILTAYIIEHIIRRTLVEWSSKTETELDDQIIGVLRRPIFLSVILSGLAWAAAPLGDGTPRFIAYAVLKTMAVLVWAAAAFQICVHVLEAFSRRAKEGSVIQPRTLPLFDILVKIAVIGAMLYFTLLSWHIDVTAWLASAGIVGIAVGFAAKDSLANLISGIFILADSPYKVGDFIVLDGSLRGEVTRIGIRSTRILTRDDVEITIPNAIIGNAKIINEHGGPHIKQRVRIQVSVAYTSDIDQVAKVLLGCIDGVEEVCETPTPEVRFRAFGDSGLEFEILVWIADAAGRGKIISKINIIIFKRFREAGIEIPYSKHDVYIKEMPRPDA